jgi:hypothetical protein
METIKINMLIPGLVSGPMISKPSDNQCIYCEQSLLLLRSMNKAVCVHCCIDYQWLLSKGQKPLIVASR